MRMQLQNVSNPQSLFCPSHVNATAKCFHKFHKRILTKPCECSSKNVFTKSTKLILAKSCECSSKTFPQKPQSLFWPSHAKAAAKLFSTKSTKLILIKSCECSRKTFPQSPRLFWPSQHFDWVMHQQDIDCMYDVAMFSLNLFFVEMFTKLP